MNKYYIKVPYSYLKFGDMTCHVYAENEEEALALVREYDHRFNEDYEDCGDSGDTNYEYENSDIDLEESDVEPPEHPLYHPNSNSSFHFHNLPQYFLAEINLI